MRKRLLMVCLALTCVASLAFATDFAVVAHASNPVKAMTLADLGKIFRGKTATWQNGRSITLVLREPDSPGMKFVIEKVLGGTLEEGKAILNEPGRKTVLSAWQERKKAERRHPFLDEMAPFGLVPSLQALMLARHLRGDIDAYPPWFWK